MPQLIVRDQDKDSVIRNRTSQQEGSTSCLLSSATPHSSSYHDDAAAEARSLVLSASWQPEAAAMQRRLLPGWGCWSPPGEASHPGGTACRDLWRCCRWGAATSAFQLHRKKNRIISTNSIMVVPSGSFVFVSLFAPWCRGAAGAPTLWWRQLQEWHQSSLLAVTTQSTNPYTSDVRLRLLLPQPPSVPHVLPRSAFWQLSSCITCVTAPPPRRPQRSVWLLKRAGGPLACCMGGVEASVGARTAAVPWNRRCRTAVPQRQGGHAPGCGQAGG